MIFLKDTSLGVQEPVHPQMAKGSIVGLCTCSNSTVCLFIFSHFPLSLIAKSPGRGMEMILRGRSSLLCPGFWLDHGYMC